MGTLWYCLVTMMIVGYVVFDGYDLGAGIVYLGLAKTEDERQQVLDSIGPLWDGNEVWLVALGGTVFFAFPRLYATAFSGFYLPLMIVLWLLIVRGIALAFRNQVHDALWRTVCDAGFAAASVLLALVFGVALGNVIRGVGFEASGNFFLPLWTNFGIGASVGALDWYTATVGLCAVCTLVHHGALWLACRTRGELGRRAHGWANLAGPLVLATGAIVTVMTFWLQPRLTQHLQESPWGVVFPLTAVAGVAAARLWSVRLRSGLAFVASSISIAGMLGSAAFGIFPYVLPSRTDPALALTIQNASGAPDGLTTALVWWIPGMLLVLTCVAYVHWLFIGGADAPTAG